MARFGGTGKCMWGCEAADCIKHYAVCPVIWSFAAKKLRLQPPATPEERRLTFFSLHKAWTKHDTAEVTLRAILRYAAYRAHNAWRTSGRRIPGAPGLLRQAAIQAVKGHGEAQATLDNVWALPHRGAGGAAQAG